MSCATWYEGTSLLSSLPELTSFLLLLLLLLLLCCCCFFVCLFFFSLISSSKPCADEIIIRRKLLWPKRARDISIYTVRSPRSVAKFPWWPVRQVQGKPIRTILFLPTMLCCHAPPCFTCVFTLRQSVFLLSFLCHSLKPD